MKTKKKKDLHDFTAIRAYWLWFETIFGVEFVGSFSPITGSFSSDHPALNSRWGALNFDGGTLTLDGGTRHPAFPQQFKYFVEAIKGMGTLTYFLQNRPRHYRSSRRKKYRAGKTKTSQIIKSRRRGTSKIQIVVYPKLYMNRKIMPLVYFVLMTQILHMTVVRLSQSFPQLGVD